MMKCTFTQWILIFLFTALFSAKLHAIPIVTIDSQGGFTNITISGLEALGTTWEVTIHDDIFANVVYDDPTLFDTFLGDTSAATTASQALADFISSGTSQLPIYLPYWYPGCRDLNECYITTVTGYSNNGFGGPAVRISDNEAPFVIGASSPVANYPEVTVATWVDLGAVPIPAAAWLFGSGLLGLIGVARRKKV